MSVSSFKNHIFPTGIVIFWICYGIYYPNFYSIEDERIYLEKAYHISQGSFFSEDIDNYLDISINKYPPGQPILLSFFLKIGYRYIFLLNPLLLTLLTIILSIILRKNAIPNYFALLILFHPAMFIFSRTIMSDIPAAFFFMLAIWLLLYHKNLHFFGAFALGFTNSLRLAIFPFSGIFLLYVIWQQKNNGRKLCEILFGYFLGIIPFLYYIYQVNIFSPTVYAFDIGTFISMEGVLSNAFIYLLSLNLIYPLMFILGIISRYKKETLLKCICIIALFFFPFFYGYPPFYFYPSKDNFISLVLNQRYFLFVISPLFVGYSYFLSRKVITNEKRFLVIFLLMIIGASVISYVHQNVLNQQYDFHEVIHNHTTEDSLLITNEGTTELIQILFGKRRILNTDFIRNPEDILRQVELFQPGDVFLIYLDRKDGKEFIDRRLLIAVLEYFQYQEIVHFQKGWDLKIYRIKPL